MFGCSDILVASYALVVLNFLLPKENIQSRCHSCRAAYVEATVPEFLNSCGIAGATCTGHYVETEKTEHGEIAQLNKLVMY